MKGSLKAYRHTWPFNAIKSVQISSCVIDENNVKKGSNKNILKESLLTNIIILVQTFTDKLKHLTLGRAHLYSYPTLILAVRFSIMSGFKYPLVPCQPDKCRCKPCKCVSKSFYVMSRYNIATAYIYICTLCILSSAQLLSSASMHKWCNFAAFIMC